MPDANTPDATAGGLSAARFLSHLGSEAARTRLYLATFEAADMDTPPAAGMMTARELAIHLAACWQWLRMAIVENDPDFKHFQLTATVADGAEAARLYTGEYRKLKEGLSGLGEAGFGRMVKAFGSEMPASDLCLDLLFHDCHHRGQLAAALRAAGRTPPDIYKAGEIPEGE
ncbi:MAG TPA: DinB family protein [Candidatus Eisenbacteria bacterium]